MIPSLPDPFFFFFCSLTSRNGSPRYPDLFCGEVPFFPPSLSPLRPGRAGFRGGPGPSAHPSFLRSLSFQTGLAIFTQEPSAFFLSIGSSFFSSHPCPFFPVHLLTTELGGLFVSRPSCRCWLPLELSPYHLVTARLRWSVFLTQFLFFEGIPFFSAGWTRPLPPPPPNLSFSSSVSARSTFCGLVFFSSPLVPCPFIFSSFLDLSVFLLDRTRRPTL